MATSGVGAVGEGEHKGSVVGSERTGWWYIQSC